jgi:aminopeptidase N/puromycin-sensitive aminopeptidase
MKRVLAVVVWSVLATLGVSAQRLPENAVPDAYDLKFEPDLGSATFAGEETIHVHLEKATTSIVLNSAEIEFKEAWVGSADFKQAAAVSKDEKNETATLTVPSAVPAGPAEIHIRFTGILNDKLRGFYLSQTARRRYAVTQFEATDARRAFPSFDEPAYKAVFRVALVVDKADTAISNGKIVSDTPGPGSGKHTLQFSDSPKMSSYLVAMMVGDFACITGGADGIPIRVCAVPEKKDLLSYALLSAENILKFYDSYYQIKYPYQKLDIIAFPDFSAGAMENVAAITYRETLLTIDDRNASVDAHRAVVGVLAHEMAHMWFGDLVTMKWWDDIWLNEGFATWMSFKPMKAWKPEWHDERGEIQETGASLSTDSIASVRAIRAKAETPAEISTLFDGIAYGKAASVLRMVEAYVGPDVFQKGANLYLEKHAYGNATAEDFWNQMAATSEKPVDRIMATFTEQSGAPLITMKSACSESSSGGGGFLKKKKNKSTTQVTLSQERYFADSTKLGSGSQELWQIPVSLRPDGAKDVTYVLLAQRQQTFELPGCSPWVYANAGGRGYYRSDYDAPTVAKMSAELETSFSPEERIHFLSDEWAMVRVGRMNIGDYLDTLEKMKGERTRAVVNVMTDRFGEIHDRVASAADRAAFEKWVRDLLQPMAAELGENPVAGESDDRRALRSDVFGALASDGRDPQLLAKSRVLVEQYMRDPNSVDAALAGNALVVSAFDGNVALYDRYVEHMKTAKTPEEYYNYFSALMRFPSAGLAKRTFELALSPDVRNQDLYQIGGLLGNAEVQAAAWELFKSNYPAMAQKSDASLSAGFSGFAGYFCDEKLRDDSQDFFASQNLLGSERVLQNAKDSVNACIGLRSLQQANLSSFLRKMPAKGAGQASH